MSAQSDLVQEIAASKFEELARRIHKHQQPHCGWKDLRQLPRLTDAERATILRAHKGIAYDIVLNAHELADAIERGDLDEYVSTLVRLQLGNAIPRALLDQLQYIDRKDDELDADLQLAAAEEAV